MTTSATHRLGKVSKN